MSMEMQLFFPIVKNPPAYLEILVIYLKVKNLNLYSQLNVLLKVVAFHKAAVYTEGVALRCYLPKNGFIECNNRM